MATNPDDLGNIGPGGGGGGHCPAGYHWNGKKCVKDASGAHQCPPGQHWSNQQKRCVKAGDCQPPPGGCPADMVWSKADCRCVPSSRQCPDGEHFDPAKGKCVKNQECGPNQHWDDRLKKCVANDGGHNCPDGQHWSEEQGKCVANAHPCGEGTVWDEKEGKCVPDTSGNTSGDDIRDLLKQFLRDNELCPDAACTEPMSFITAALAQNKSYNEIIAELRQTDWYKAAYPENDVRQANGYSFMPESQIRQYRLDAKRIASNLLGVDVSNQEVANLIQNNVSLTEWESRLNTWEDFKRWGPTVRSVLEEELGHRIPDDKVFAFLDPSISSPELDKAYEDALYRGRPALLGLGVRPQDEADMLRRYGIDVNQAFRGYQGIVSEMPKAERLNAIEQAINGNQALPSNGSALFNDTPFATLFAAIQLGDADAIRKLQDQMAREVARFSGGGGAAFRDTQAVGLLTSGDRAQG